MFAIALALTLAVNAEEPVKNANPQNAAAPTAAPRAVAARSMQTSVSLAGRPALVFDVRSPRIESAELARTMAKPELLEILNSKYLADCGEMHAARPFLFGNEHLAAGRYSVGVAIANDGALSLRLTQDGSTTAIALENNAPAADAKWAVPQLTFAFLAGAEVETFRLELRFGVYSASAPLEFSLPRIIVELNNNAHDLLSKADRNAQDVVKALYLAGRATKMTSDANPLILDTYAMALFHAGQVDAAIETQRRALTLLEPAQDAHRKGMTERLAAYGNARGN
jgi:hypothetical protein